MNKKTTTLLVLMILVALLSMGSYYGIIWYVGFLDNSSVLLEQSLTDSQYQYQQEEATRRTILSAGDSIGKLQTYIAPAGQELELVKMVEQLADLSHLAHTTNLLELDQLSQLAAQHKELLHIDISTTGNWQQTMHFLSLLETLPYNVKMNKVSFSGGSGPSATASTSSVIWNGNFDLSLVKEKDNS